MTGDMLTHVDEPATKKSIIDDLEDDIQMGGLAIAAQRGSKPGVISDQSGVEDQAFAAQRGIMPGVEGCLKSVTSNGDAVAKAMKAEDELILNKAILGHSLCEIYSNGRIQFAVNRSSMEHLNTQLSSTDVCEIFSPERVAAVCGRMGLTPGESMDIKSGYDFDTAVDRKRSWESIICDEPLLIIGSPPCTMFS